jgi:hypothetical protein
MIAEKLNYSIYAIFLIFVFHFWFRILNLSWMLFSYGNHMNELSLLAIGKAGGYASSVLDPPSPFQFYFIYLHDLDVNIRLKLLAF